MADPHLTRGRPVRRPVLAGTVLCLAGIAPFAFLHSQRRASVPETPAGPEAVRVDSVSIVWQSPELVNPRTMVLEGRRLVIADPTQVHFLPLQGGRPVTVGRDGGGPGEYRSIRELAVLPGDSVEVDDPAQFRISVLSPTGTFARSTRTTPRFPFVNPKRSGDVDALVRQDGGVLFFRQENVYVHRPTRLALVWHSLTADTERVLESWDDLRYHDWSGGFIGPSAIYTPVAVVALSASGELAYGDGWTYCISVQRVADARLQGSPHKFCRDIRPVHPGHGLSDPDPNVLLRPVQRAVLRAAIRHQKVPDHIPAYDRLRFDSQGRLWVRTLGPEMADINPIVLRARPELGPPRRNWDVWSRSGTLIATVSLPSAFDPRVILANRAYGFYTLPTGEVVIGAVTFKLGA